MNLLFCRFPEGDKQTVALQSSQFHTEVTIADADNRNPRHLDGSNQISHSTLVARRHAINLVHYQDVPSTL